MKFCSVINCMDGRIQLPVNKYLQKRFDAEFVDTITEPGPNLILSENNNQQLVDSIIFRLRISVEKHSSVGIAIVGHHDCAGNPNSDNEQMIQIKNSIKLVKNYFKELNVIGLWVNENWKVEEVFYYD